MATLAVSSIAPAGCGCRSPERPLPSTDDPKYAAIEQMIERTLLPSIDISPNKITIRPREIRELTALGYFNDTSQGYILTAYGRSRAYRNNWPSVVDPRRHYGDLDFVTFPIGKYTVQKLTAAHHYDAAPCGAFDDEHDTYDFIGPIKLNTLGRVLYTNRFLYLGRTDISAVQPWGGRRALNGVWSASVYEQDPDHEDAPDDDSVFNRGETIDLESSLL